jgi:metal-responsive CopG/Arc/MetJ family transcriptional regulator
MKVKISITLSSELLNLIDQRQAEFKSRSEFLERAAREMLAQLAITEAERCDLEIINRYANELNVEAEDVLAYQAPL